MCKDCTNIYGRAWRKSKGEYWRTRRRRNYRRRNGVPDVDPHRGDRCGICGYEHRDGAIGHERLVPDHDHDTGIFRGFLCDLHNRAISFFDEDPNLLRKAAKYLRGGDS